MKWYKRDPDAALVGMQSLTDEQYRAYNVILDLLYSRNGKVPDEERFMCSHLNWDPRKWRRVRGELLALGKLHLEGYFLANYRATSELGGYFQANYGGTSRQTTPLVEGNSPAKSTKPADRIEKRDYKEKKTDTKIELVGGERDTPIPENWSPEEGKVGISPIDLWELGKFRDHALETGRRCANWDAAWRRWKRTEWYGKGYKEGASTSVISEEDIDARRKAMHELNRLRALNGGLNDEEIREKIRRNTGIG